MSFVYEVTEALLFYKINALCMCGLRKEYYSQI